MPVRPRPNRRRTHRGRAANRNRRRRQNNGAPLDVNAGNDEVGVATNNESNVVGNVAGNDAAVGGDLNVVAVVERVGDVHVGNGPVLNGPVVNNDRVVELAVMARDQANGPEDQDSGDDSDDSSDDEAHMNRLSVGERVRLRRRIEGRITRVEIQRISEKAGEIVMTHVNRPHDPTRIILSFSKTMLLAAMSD